MRYNNNNSFTKCFQTISSKYLRSPVFLFLSIACILTPYTDETIPFLCLLPVVLQILVLILHKKISTEVRIDQVLLGMLAVCCNIISYGFEENLYSARALHILAVAYNIIAVENVTLTPMYFDNACEQENVQHKTVDEELLCQTV